MAQAPRLKRLSREDYPEAPEWFSRYLDSANPFFGDVTSALGSGIDRTNLSIQTEKFSLVTKARVDETFPLDVKNKLGRAPVEVRISQISVSKTPTYVPGTPTLVTSFLNSWSSYVATDPNAEAPGYLQDAAGRAWLFGVATGGTPSATSVIFTLPAGMRPAKNLSFAVISNASPAYCEVKSDGSVIAWTGSGAWYSLEGISFLPYDSAHDAYNPLAALSWELTQSGTVRIHNIPGLAPSTTYDVTLTIE